MRRLPPLALSLLLLLPLAACSDDAADSEPGSSASEDGGSAGGTALPTVDGEFGEKPTLAIPEGDPPAELQSEVILEGDGPVVASGELLVANYLGQTWAGTDGEPNVFDNSYDRGAPAMFPIGTGGVIEGWDATLVGVAAGSRVLMSVPPEQGYGEEGQPAAGIEGDDTLVFVVDVVASYPADIAIDGTPTEAALPPGVTVTGAPGERPTVAIAPGTPPPTERSLTVLAEGTGPALPADGSPLVHVLPVSWGGQQVPSTWDQAPQIFPIGAEGPDSPLGLLAGVPVGSRVLLVIPAEGGGDPATQSLAVVIDVLGLPGAEQES